MLNNLSIAPWILIHNYICCQSFFLATEMKNFPSTSGKLVNCYNISSVNLLHRVFEGKIRAMSSTGHEIQSFFTSYLVPHFSEVWKCGVVWQSKDIVARSPSHRTLCHSLLSSTLLKGVEVWKSPTK